MPYPRSFSTTHNDEATDEQRACNNVERQTHGEEASNGPRLMRRQILAERQQRSFTWLFAGYLQKSGMRHCGRNAMARKRKENCHMGNLEVPFSLKFHATSTPVADFKKSPYVH